MDPTDIYAQYLNVKQEVHLDTTEFKTLYLALMNKELFHNNIVWIAIPVSKLGYWPGNRRNQVRFPVNTRDLYFSHSVLPGSSLSCAVAFPASL